MQMCARRDGTVIKADGARRTPGRMRPGDRQGRCRGGLAAPSWYRRWCRRGTVAAD